MIPAFAPPSPYRRQPRTRSRASLKALSALTMLAALSAWFPEQARAQNPPATLEQTVVAEDLRGNERIWGLILHASEREVASAGDTKQPERQFRAAALEGVLEKVRKALPRYKEFRVLGAHDQKVLREYATWITPSTDFFLAIDSKGRAKEGDGINIYLQLWSRQIDSGKDDKVLLKSDVVLKRSSPLIIEGPNWRDGRVVFVLTLEYSELFTTETGQAGPGQ